MIFVGIALAVITLIVEYWYYKYKKPNSSVDSDMMAKQLQVTLNDSDEYFCRLNQKFNNWLFVWLLCFVHFLFKNMNKRCAKIHQVRQTKSVVAFWITSKKKFKQYKCWGPQSPALHSNCFELPSDWLLSYLESQSEGSSKQLLYRAGLWAQVILLKLCYQ